MTIHGYSINTFQQITTGRPSRFIVDSHKNAKIDSTTISNDIVHFEGTAMVPYIPELDPGVVQRLVFKTTTYGINLHKVIASKQQPRYTESEVILPNLYDIDFNARQATGTCGQLALWSIRKLREQFKDKPITFMLVAGGSAKHFNDQTSNHLFIVACAKNDEILVRQQLEALSTLSVLTPNIPISRLPNNIYIIDPSFKEQGNPHDPGSNTNKYSFKALLDEGEILSELQRNSVFYNVPICLGYTRNIAPHLKGIPSESLLHLMFIPDTTKPAEQASFTALPVLYSTDNPYSRERNESVSTILVEAVTKRNGYPIHAFIKRIFTAFQDPANQPLRWVQPRSMI